MSGSSTAIQEKKEAEVRVGITGRRRWSLVAGRPDMQLQVLEKYELLDEKKVSTSDFVNVYNRLQVKQKEHQGQLASRTITTQERQEIETQVADLINHQSILISIAGEVLNYAKSMPSCGKDALRELIDFARIQDNAFIKALLEHLVIGHTFSDPLLMQSLKAVLLTIGDAFYESNIDTLFRIADILLEQLSRAHLQGQSYHEFVDTLEALQVTWLALSLGGAQGASEIRWKKHADYFKELSKHKYMPIAYRAKLMCQSLARIDRDTGPAWKKNCVRGYQLLSGVIMVADAVMGTNVTSLEEGFARIFSAVHPGDLAKKEWYDTVMVLEAALGEAVQSVSHFKYFVGILASTIKNSPRKTELSYGLFELIERVALSNSINPEIRCEAISALQDMYKDKNKWHADIVPGRNGRGNGDEELRAQALETLVNLTLALPPKVAEKAKEALKHLHTYASAKSKGNAYKQLAALMPKGDIPSPKSPNLILKRAEEAALATLPVSKQLLGYVVHKIKSQRVTPIPSLFFPPAEVDRLLLHVVRGEQEKAKAMLEEKPGLARQASTVTDLSNREFKGITAFQYALWALDFHMWTMLLDYLPLELAAQQLQDLKQQGTAHGPRFVFDTLINTLQTYVDNIAIWAVQYANNTPAWIAAVGPRDWIKVGQAQCLLPAHVVNEYCTFTDQSTFEPEEKLVRSLETSNGNWFEATYSGKKLGEAAFVRSGPTALPTLVGGTQKWIKKEWCEMNLTVLKKLAEKRITEWQALEARLQAVLERPATTSLAPHYDNDNTPPLHYDNNGDALPDSTGAASQSLTTPN